MSAQIDFYTRSNRKTRVDTDIDWHWYYGMMTLRKRASLYLRPILERIHREKYKTLDFKKHWFVTHTEELWRTRVGFHDDLSRKEFDSFLVTAICGFERFFYSRLHFDEIIKVTNVEPFTEDLPKEYMGLPLNLYSVTVQDAEIPAIKIISAKEEIDVTNDYRRYLIERDGVSFVPQPGDVVFDLGSCIGEISTVLASFVGATGHVHLFDPIPLHNKYGALQIANNPTLKNVMSIHEVGVGDVSQKRVGTVSDVSSISPGGCNIDNFDLVSLDDFVRDAAITKVDYIKMDIEGAEVDALKGATHLIKQHSPKLAISCYHKGSHLWEIADTIREINPTYKIYMEQHLPIECDAIMYASV